MNGPLYRMAGSKSQIVDIHIAHIRNHRIKQLGSGADGCYRRWVDPFGGSWTVSLAAMRAGLAESYYLGDSCPGMVAVLQELQAGGEELITAMVNFLGLAFEEQRATFLEMRPQDPKARIQRAVRHLVLQGCSFNGLMRTNKKGVYNVPFGLEYLNKKTKLIERSNPHVRLEDLHDASQLLREHAVYVRLADFRETIQHAGRGDCAYSDPPYWGTHSAFGPKVFDEADHRALAVEHASAKLRGADGWVAGSECVGTRKTYLGEEVFQVTATRNISRDGQTRGKIKELLIRI